MSVGQKIRNRRKELGMTQKQLGELCGMADSAIRKYESGRITPKQQTLQKIARALQTTEWELLGADFESHDDGSSAVIIDLDGIDKKIAQKLTASNDPKGIRLGLALETESDRKALEHILENGSTPPEYVARLLSAFEKLNFPMQKMLVEHAENMLKYNSFMDEISSIEQLVADDTKE